MSTLGFLDMAGQLCSLTEVQDHRRVLFLVDSSHVST